MRILTEWSCRNSCTKALEEIRHIERINTGLTPQTGEIWAAWRLAATQCHYLTLTEDHDFPLYLLQRSRILEVDEMPPYSYKSQAQWWKKNHNSWWEDEHQDLQVSQSAYKDPCSMSNNPKKQSKWAREACALAVSLGGHSSSIRWDALKTRRQPKGKGLSEAFLGTDGAERRSWAGCNRQALPQKSQFL